MKNATVRQLKVFETVARHLSYSRAAQELHLTQPAVSTQVAKLEEHAGLPLLEQVGRRIDLTAAGQELLHHCRVILRQFEQAQEAMTQCRGVRGGRLEVAAISAGDYFLPRLLVEFVRRHEGVTLNLQVCNRRELLERMADNLTDLAVLVRPPPDEDMLAEAFAPHPYVIVAAPGHALAGQRRIPMARLLQERFVVREKGSDTWASMQDGLGGDIERLRIAMEIRSMETLKQAVIAGLGVGFLSAHTIALELKAASLVVLDVEGFPLMLNWYVVHRRGKRLPPVARAFRDFLLAEGEAQMRGFLPFDMAPAAARRRPGRAATAKAAAPRG